MNMFRVKILQNIINI